MTSTSLPTLPAAEALYLHALVSPPDRGIASRVLAKTSGGSLTLFAFDGGEGLTEHSSPFDAMVLPLEGELRLVIGGTPVDAAPGTVVRMPANVPHAVEAVTPARMLLVMLREASQP